MLRKLKIVTLYHYIEGVIVEGAHGDITGDLTGVTGDLTDITGGLTDITGSLSGIWGDISGVTGNLDECGITEQDRLRGIAVEDLVE
jgi:hypothetical protein